MGKFDKASGDQLLFDRLKDQALATCYGSVKPVQHPGGGWLVR
jgi:hypothetical protein